MKLIMTKGLPGSGKTTWAKEQNAFRVNKDDLRSMMNNGHWSKTNEKYVLLIRDQIIELHLADGNDVIVDDTNLAPKHAERLQELAKKHGAEFEIKDFTDIPIEECIKRDQKRANYVGEKVIRGMYRNFLQPKPPVYFWEPTLPEAIICDIDGTLALFGEKNPYERDFEKDDLNPAVNNILHAMKKFDAMPHKILLVSGRMDKYRDQTEAWLKKWNIPYEFLWMRKTDDVRKDVIIKKEIWEEHIKGKYNILFVLDDRNQVVEFWRSLGLTCLQVTEGDF